LDNMSLDA